MTKTKMSQSKQSTWEFESGTTHLKILASSKEDAFAKFAELIKNAPIGTELMTIYNFYRIAKNGTTKTESYYGLTDRLLEER